MQMRCHTMHKIVLDQQIQAMLKTFIIPLSQLAQGQVLKIVCVGLVKILIPICN